MEPLQVLVVDDEPGMRLGVKRALEFLQGQPAGNGRRDGLRHDGGRNRTGSSGGHRARRNRTSCCSTTSCPTSPAWKSWNAWQTVRASMLTIMITAFASLETAITATKRGAYDFLAKPFTPEELRSTVRKAAKQCCCRGKPGDWPKRNARFVSNSFRCWPTN